MKKAGQKNVLWGVCAVAAALLLVLGLVFGGAADVHQKASHVCLECVGIG